ncbi:heme utilization cystosolic carrier protein HutX [Thaumasiovibrio subtropicus]|uniref:heme utilization cystosolic carrier protein HutX n=1 Tax=Thaumasiovibrio subtropicus TaxID=1891207 RepID=UPI000B3635CF|nr:heme utilization cystosolic carrier protein HutX [Thaumasiovibrio subtropicus]
MYNTRTYEETQTRVAALIENDPSISVPDLASTLEQTEAEVSLALPPEMVTPVEGAHAEAILNLLPEWGPVTTIVISHGSVFEVKAPFPKGKFGRGYFNLMGENGELHGHLKLDLITDIGLISKPFMGKESHHIAFYNGEGACVFKVYLGRDEKRKLLPEQLVKFQQLKKDFKK